MAKSKPPSEPFDPFTNLIQPASEDLKSTLPAAIQSRRKKVGDPAAPDRVQSEPPFAIVAVKTLCKDEARSVFSWDEDALELVIDVAVAAGLDPAIRFDANFQVVDYATNNVRKDIWSRGLRPRPGETFPIRPGDNGDMTPERWGLSVGLYLFRAILEIKELHLFCSSQQGALFRVR